MAAAGNEPPERVAYETLRGDIDTGPVVGEDYDTRDCRPIQLLQVQVSDRNTRWFERDEVVAVEEPTNELRDHDR